MKRLVDLHRRDTICAAATAPLPSAIGLIRVSGPEALDILKKVFVPKKGSQQFFVATLGDVRELDEALCVCFPKDKSYTGETSFELSLHGNPLIMKNVLSLLQKEGCRLAEPGEFSMRAVLSGKMDLCAAEAVCDLISAQSQEAAQVALRNVKGGLGKYLEPLRAAIVDNLCEIEARLDFPDEDLGATKRIELIGNLAQSQKTLQQLLKGALLGARLTQGARLVLLGAPNAGKSTLLNCLVGEERALVHHLPGTTRDVVEVVWMVEGIPVTLVDVAGIRDTENIDSVEAMGIEKALLEIERADGILWLRDGAKLHQDGDQVSSLVASLSVPVLKICTKADLQAECRVLENEIWISAKTGTGIDDLCARIRQLLVNDGVSQHEALLTRVRQREEVQSASSALELAQEALEKNESEEFVAAELRSCGAALDRLLGKSLNEDVLDLIFSRFCIGK